MKRKLILGTRPSQLACKQTDIVAAGLRPAWPRLQTEVEVYITWGDRELSRPLSDSRGHNRHRHLIEPLHTLWGFTKPSQYTYSPPSIIQPRRR